MLPNLLYNQRKEVIMIKRKQEAVMYHLGVYWDCYIHIIFKCLKRALVRYDYYKYAIVKLNQLITKEDFANGTRYEEKNS